jgi:hypothetical protein
VQVAADYGYLKTSRNVRVHFITLSKRPSASIDCAIALEFPNMWFSRFSSLSTNRKSFFAFFFHSSNAKAINGGGSRAKAFGNLNFKFEAG